VWRCMGRDNRILEYDPDYAKHEMKHREYLQNPGLFKQAVPIIHQPTLAKIHLNFRLTYLKDVVGRVYLVLPISNMCYILPISNMCYILSHHPPRQGATLLLAAFALCAGACVQVLPVVECGRRKQGCEAGSSLAALSRLMEGCRQSAAWFMCRETETKVGTCGGWQVMARYIDDISFSTMRELILLNNVEIIAHIQADTPFLNKLFQVCPSCAVLLCGGARQRRALA